MMYHMGLERFQEFDDMTMIKYYSVQYHMWRTADLQEELQDIYGSSASRMAYTDDGLTVVGNRVENLAMRAVAVNEQLDQVKTRFKRHTDNLNDVMAQCTPKERKQVSEYLTAGYKELFKTVFIPESLPDYPVIQRIKKDLYTVELQQRRDRHGYDEQVKRIKAEQKAKALARSKLKAYQRGRAWERWWENERKSGN